MPRRSVLGAGLLAAAAALVGCAAPSEPRPGTLIWATGRITAGGPAQAVADVWNRAHRDGPVVRIVALPESVDDQHELLSIELGAGVPDIDVVDLDVVWTAEFAAHGWLTDLTDLREAVTATSQPIPVQSATWDDRLWAAPYTTDAGLLYYRSDLVDPPASWPELVDEGTRAARRAGIAPYVVDGAPSEGLVVEFLEYLWREGGGFRVDGAVVQLDTEPAVRALRFVRDAYRTGFFATDTQTKLLEDARRTFQDGGAVFLRSWPYAYRLINGADPASRIQGHVGVAPLPTNDGRGAVAALGGHNLGVSRFSRSPRAAAEFVRFACTDLDVQRMLARQWSVAPTAVAAYAGTEGDPVLSTLRQVLPWARTRPATELWSEMSQETAQQIVVGSLGRRSSPEDAVAGLQRLLVSSAVSR